jgi:hypothetical protein
MARAAAVDLAPPLRSAVVVPAMMMMPGATRPAALPAKMLSAHDAADGQMIAMPSVAIVAATMNHAAVAHAVTTMAMRAPVPMGARVAMMPASRRADRPAVPGVMSMTTAVDRPAVRAAMTMTNAVVPPDARAAMTSVSHAAAVHAVTTMTTAHVPDAMIMMIALAHSAMTMMMRCPAVAVAPSGMMKITVLAFLSASSIG